MWCIGNVEISDKWLSSMGVLASQTGQNVWMVR